MARIVCPCVGSTTIAVFEQIADNWPGIPNGTTRRYANDNFGTAGTVQFGSTGQVASSPNAFLRQDLLRRVVLQFDVAELMTLGTVHSAVLTLGNSGTTQVTAINIAQALVRACSESSQWNKNIV